ncbi:MAG: beta-ketoacyl-ACP synthase II [Armatimonadetes bacterium]|nr:beta-ketoacyl-ACP synthase II [Armatimonadota bacterium]MCX7967988.1 beta-ketoacyl-ACP synthase II [Armatimonadota bacterium]MDW8142398.1 beta-ketoacyl-ACP synthase II [Armatimonadota bacterium]
MSLWRETEPVVITGIGLITALGTGAEKSWEGIKASKSGIKRITRFDPAPFPSQIAGEVDDFDPEAFIDPREVRKMDRYAQFAAAATFMALQDSSLSINANNAERIGVCIGSGIGGAWTWEENHTNLLQKGPRGVSPRFIPMMISDIAAGHVAILTGAKGPNFATVTACATAGHAIGMAAMTIKMGLADVMIAGGSEAAISPLSLAGFCSMKALSTRNDEPERASRPFDVNRDGFVMAEGAGVVILERLSHAVKRGAKIYAELAGFGMSGDAYHLTAMCEDGDGPARSMLMALETAGLTPAEVDYINAHATSTPQGDPAEVKAIKRAFGEVAYKVPVSSTKSMHGHTLGAAGAVELIVCLLAIRDQILPPTINLEQPDPECDLDFVPNKPRPARVEVAMSNSFGFGGHNATLIVRRWEKPEV